MNIIEILTAVGISSVLPIVIAGFTNRKINNATAGNSIADYVITGTVEDVIPKMIKYYKKNTK